MARITSDLCAGWSGGGGQQPDGADDGRPSAQRMVDRDEDDSALAQSMEEEEVEGSMPEVRCPTVEMTCSTDMLLCGSAQGLHHLLSSRS